MRNVLAIAGKELRSYFASPIAFVIIGLFALLFGLFFQAYLRVFVEQSQRMAMMGGGGNVNVNEQMIRGVLQNAAVIILFVMPMITMRMSVVSVARRRPPAGRPARAGATMA